MTKNRPRSKIFLDFSRDSVGSPGSLRAGRSWAGLVISSAIVGRYTSRRHRVRASLENLHQLIHLSFRQLKPVPEAGNLGTERRYARESPPPVARSIDESANTRRPDLPIESLGVVFLRQKCKACYPTRAPPTEGLRPPWRLGRWRCAPPGSRRRRGVPRSRRARSTGNWSRRERPPPPARPGLER